MINIRNNVSLKEFTTIRIGGVSKYFIDVSSLDELVEVIRYANEKNLRYFVLGNGSNVLINDKYFDGLVIRINKQFGAIKWLGYSRVEVSSGCLLSTFINECRNKRVSCIEKLYGIPGTIGGSIYGNAGANGCCIGDYVESVKVLDNGVLRVMNVEECMFGYRESIFKTNKNMIIVSAIMKCKKVDKILIDSEITKVIRKRRMTQPINKFSCGCIFKNVNNISAWKYIKLLDLKFDDSSNVCISELHSSFIINRRDGTFKDVYNLIESIKNSVYYIYNIRLHEEVEINRLEVASMQHSVDEFEIKRNNHLLSITKKRVVRIIAIFLIWALVITYMFLPVSKMKGIKVTGNVFLSDAKVVEIAHIDSRTFRWDFNKDEAEDLLNNYQFDQYKIIKSAKIKNNILSVSINVNEVFPLGTIDNSVLFSNGNKIPMVSYLANTPSYYIESVGTLPVLTINDLNDDSLENFVTYSSKVSNDYIKLRQEKTLVSIENIEVPASPEDEVYKYTFEEIKDNTTFVFNILVSPSRIATKLTYDYYELRTKEAMDRALLDGSYDGTIVVNVDFVGSWNVVEIIKG